MMMMSQRWFVVAAFFSEGSVYEGFTLDAVLTTTEMMISVCF